LRDEVITMFLAGHETTALAITYGWFLLSHHPDVAQRLFDEVDQVLGDRPATAADVGDLPYLGAIVKETLRMYSPAWIIGREPIEDVQIGPYLIPKGSQVLMPQSVVHYDERWFENPYDFRPERWLDGLEKRLPRFAYFPFGGGARVCIGNHFATMEAILIIATMAQRFDLENVMTQELDTQPSVTLRPTVPVDMRLHAR
jgi:cytochrome P450